MRRTLSVLATMVAHKTWPWTPIAVRSLAEHFPQLPVLIVDNNPSRGSRNWDERCRIEQEWLASQPQLFYLRNHSQDLSAGNGINLAMRQARQWNVDLLLHIEPDCLISGREWFDLLLEPIHRGAWMSGPLKRFYGPIHPVPSLWRVDVKWRSFSAGLRGEDENHSRFADVFDLPCLLDWVSIHEPEAVAWWKGHWDTAQRTWFDAAVMDRAALVLPGSGFQHFWYGSRRPPDLSRPEWRSYVGDVLENGREREDIRARSPFYFGIAPEPPVAQAAGPRFT